MKCFYCKNDSTTESKTTEVFEYNNNLIIIRNIPCLECEQCGEKFFTDNVMGHLEKLANEAKKMILEVSIIDYAQVA